MTPSFHLTMPHKRMVSHELLFLLLAILALGSPAAANGIYDNGVGARSMAMGGADVAWAADPLGAMGVNPAGLAFLPTPELTLGGIGGFVQGHFDKPGVSSGDLNGNPAAVPEAAFAMPLGKWPVVVGLSFVPESTALVNWHYPDPPGGLGGISYGPQQDRAEIINLRSAIGIAGQVTSQLSIGASVGLIYNKNELTTPYIFQNLQNSGGLDGAKTLLNLQTEGLGWDAQVGIIYRPTPDLQFGVSYQSPCTVVSTGDATGDPSTQFGLPQGSLPFHYDATATNTLPQQVRAGVSWKFQPQWRAAAQLDWIDWSDAFKTLPLSFSNGNNGTVNGALGRSFTEAIPLNWKSEFVYRIGVEYNVTPNLDLRLGYCYGNSPVPVSTLTPLNAAVLENTITAGAGYHWGRYEVDFAYQYDFPSVQNIGTSGLRSGEYSNSTVEVSAHEFALSATVHF
jgi:long-subunit fatty acid transport protein